MSEAELLNGKPLVSRAACRILQAKFGFKLAWHKNHDAGDKHKAAPDSDKEELLTVKQDNIATNICYLTRITVNSRGQQLQQSGRQYTICYRVRYRMTP